MSLQSNAISHWLGANLESALVMFVHSTIAVFHCLLSHLWQPGWLGRVLEGWVGEFMDWKYGCEFFDGYTFFGGYISTKISLHKKGQFPL